MLNAYVLTKDLNSHRAKFSKNILQKIGFNVIFFKAIKDRKPMISHRKSMYAIYEKILKEEENDYCCIFEDDINTDLNIKLEYIKNYEKLKEDIIYLGFSDYKAQYLETDNIINDKKLKKVRGGIRCIHSLMVSKKGVEILKNLYDVNPKQLHMDVLLENYTLTKPLYVIREDIVSPCENKHYGIFFQDRRIFKSQLDNHY